MKGVITSTIIWAAIIAMLCLTIADPSSGFANVAALAMWMIGSLGVLCGVLMLLMGVAATNSHTLPPEKAGKLKTSLRRTFDHDQKPSASTRAWGWVMAVTMTVLAAYAGLIVTGAFYLLSRVFYKVCFAIGKDLSNDTMADEVAAE